MSQERGKTIWNVGWCIAEYQISTITMLVIVVSAYYTTRLRLVPMTATQPMGCWTIYHTLSRVIALYIYSIFGCYMMQIEPGAWISQSHRNLYNCLDQLQKCAGHRGSHSLEQLQRNLQMQLCPHSPFDS